MNGTATNPPDSLASKASEAVPSSPRWEAVRKLRELRRELAPSPEEMREQLKMVERDVILPIKAVLVLVLCYSFFFTVWFEDVRLPGTIAHLIVKRFFLIYLVVNAGVAVILLQSHRFKDKLVQWVIFASNFLDGLLLSALAFVTGGFDSLVYWLFLGLLLRNALSTPRASAQLVLNFSAILCYLAASILDVAITVDMLDYEDIGSGVVLSPGEQFALRLIVLCLWALFCYGVPVLLEKQRRAGEEQQESTARQEQLRSAGRLAAEIAHQVKNPLSVINSAAFSIQRALQKGKGDPDLPLQIIRDEVSRIDGILTRLTGYAQWAEGQVERLDVAEEIARATAAVFPPGIVSGIVLERHCNPDLPHLLMQPLHLSEILVNLLKNAREASQDRGRVSIEARQGPDHEVVIRISDLGPGIPEEQRELVFNAYFTTKPGGTGLGLPIVRRNTEMYGGTIRLESELGKGAAFIVTLPSRTFMKLKA